MKYLLVILISLPIGYFSYPLFNTEGQYGPDRELSKLFEKFLKEEGEKYANAQDAESKLKAADELYGRMMLLMLTQLDLRAPENKPLNIQVTVQPEKKVFNETKNIIQQKKKKNTLTVAEKIISNKLDPVTVSSFISLPFLNVNDSRISKLTGKFNGKLKIKDSRTGLLENVVLEVNQDPEKNMTKFDSTDIYDNTSLNFFRETGESFRSVPGDENLLLLVISNTSSVVFDLKGFPHLKGKVFSLHDLTGEFELKKTK